MFSVLFLTSSWGGWPALMQAATSIETRTADGLQYLVLTGIITILALIYRLDHRQARLEQTLNDPDRGLVAEMAMTRRFRHVIRNRVFSHGFRLRTLEQHAELPVIDDADEDIPELGGKA